MQSHFTMVSQVKEQLEAVEEKVEEGEIVMITLNGLPRSWNSFMFVKIYMLYNSTLNCQPEKVACEMQTLYVHG